MTKKNTEHDFWGKVVKGTNGCLEWMGAKDHCGYGIFYYDNRNLLAHRYLYSIKNGPIPKGMCVCHKCDNPSCVNVDHLFLGTIQDNAHDCVNKKRTNKHKGEDHHRSKIKETDAMFIKNSDLSLSKLATIFGLCKASISYIKNGINWKHLKEQK